MAEESPTVSLCFSKTAAFPTSLKAWARTARGSLPNGFIIYQLGALQVQTSDSQPDTDQAALCHVGAIA